MFGAMEGMTPDIARSGDDRRYDEMAVTDASGQSRHDYFDVTPFFERYLPMANQPWRPPVARRPLTIRRACASIAVDVTVAR